MSRRAAGFKTYRSDSGKVVITLAPKTEYKEELQIMKIEDVMTDVGICAAALAGIGILALLIHYVSWWVVPAIGSAVILRWAIRHKEGF
jgi:hypothetical protein